MPIFAKILSFALAGIFFSFGSAAAQDVLGRSIVDDRGVTVNVPAEVKEIASVSYVPVDVALALGIKPTATTFMMEGRNPDYLLGLTKDMKSLGQRAKPNLELLSAAKPDLIIATKRYTASNAAQIENIAPYAAFNMERLGDSYREVSEISKLLGKPEAGEKLNADFTQHIAEFRAKAPKDSHPSFVIMFGGESPYAFFDEHTTATIMTQLGGKNAVGPADDPGRFGLDYSYESLLEKDPDVIILMEWVKDRSHENNPIWQQLSAVKNNRVYYAGDQWAEADGPIAREILLREGAHLLYPDTFPAIDIKAEAAKLIPASLQK
ncbi:ABC transporter substrate-binding protein [Ochrobactrum sp. S46]|nr:ABC transporter substrate-binding protein [Ochrobactrum sp. S45]MBK0046397.1 ABC transporter substrate-binding protein [Ochrobactrum sp. S46]